MSFLSNDGSLLSPKQKQESKNAALKLKFGSPKLVEMLREVKSLKLKFKSFIITSYFIEMQNQS